jgi:hypothetical protein
VAGSITLAMSIKASSRVESMQTKAQRKGYGKFRETNMQRETKQFHQQTCT